MPLAPARIRRVHLPLVALAADGAVVVVEGVVGNRVRVRDAAALAPGADSVVIDVSALAARLGGDENRVVDFFSVEPALPLTALAATASPLLPSTSTSEPPAHTPAHPSVFARVSRLVSLDRADIVVVVVYAAVVALLSLAMPLTVQALVSSVAYGNLLQPLLVLALVLVIAMVFVGALRTAQLYVVEVLQRRFFLRLVADLAWRLPRLSHHAMHEKDGSKLVNRFFDVLTVQKSSATLLLDGVVLVLELGVGLLVLALYSSQLTIFALGLLAGIAVLVFGLGRGGVKTSVAESYAKHDVAGWLEDLVRHPTAFHDSSARAFGLARADAFARAYLGARVAHFRVLLRQHVFGFVLQALAAALLLGVGGALVIRGQLTLGQLVAAELIVGALVQSMAKISKQLEVAYDLFAAVDKIGHLVDLEVEREGGVDVRPRGGLGFVIDDVTVARGAHSVRVPRLVVHAGEHVALVGPSGAGKSTVVDALLGHVDLDSGRVVVDGDDLRELRVSSWRSRVGLARGVEVIDGTVAENLRLGREGLRTRDLVDALRAVDVDDAVHAHPAGLSQPLVPSTTAFSQGQLLRLMVARALLGTPALIVVDGSFDALDPALLTRVVPAVQRRARALGATLLVTTARADIAALLQGGRVVAVDVSDHGAIVRDASTRPASSSSPGGQS